jgi:hypothetical protein
MGGPFLADLGKDENIFDIVEALDDVRNNV